ncbi:Hypothetical protein I595_3096 [Croceitalea dokdonensis DOKDO 023]|uniref:Uncharacterized protein n=1 Tax=Croceitalea dokdonensis DOKDO 023 TaxID=1300341 RepID=A0A0P7ARZ8_9FLAO|nr:hypothetical protein [Croceitalea dokdonensis]KPM30602.1 Hypothetical protein I595_3096 [Croceitalea dokdonensis DOKDO 023]
MELTNDLSSRICFGAYTVLLGSAIIGGHLTATYLLFDPSITTLRVYLGTVLVILVVNAVYFAGCLLLQLTSIPNKNQLIRAAFSLFLNIPVVIIYLFIVLQNEL